MNITEKDKYYTTRSLLALIRLCQARVFLYLFRPVSDFQTRSHTATSPNAWNWWKRPKRVYRGRMMRGNRCMTTALWSSTPWKKCVNTPMDWVLTCICWGKESSLEDTLTTSWMIRLTSIWGWIWSWKEKIIVLRSLKDDPFYTYSCYLSLSPLSSLSSFIELLIFHLNS